jgi:hypothetical protein
MLVMRAPFSERVRKRYPKIPSCHAPSDLIAAAGRGRRRKFRIGSSMVDGLKTRRPVPITFAAIKRRSAFMRDAA